MTAPIDPAPSEEWKPFATGAIRCPECNEALPILALARLVEQPARFGHDGVERVLELTPQMDDVYAHWWAHGKGGEPHCHSSSSWVWGPPMPSGMEGREYCHLALSHDGLCSDGVRTWQRPLAVDEAEREQ